MPILPTSVVFIAPLFGWEESHGFFPRPFHEPTGSGSPDGHGHAQVVRGVEQVPTLGRRATGRAMELAVEQVRGESPMVWWHVLGEG